MSSLYKKPIHLLLSLVCASSLTIGLALKSNAQEKAQEKPQDKADSLRLLKEQSALENYLDLFKMGMTHTDLRGAGEIGIKRLWRCFLFDCWTLCKYRQTRCCQACS